MAGVTAAIIAGVTALAGAGISAGGAAQQAREEKEERERLAATSEERFQQQQEQLTQQRAQTGFGLLQQNIGRASGNASRGGFARDINRALTMQRGGAQPLGGR